MREYLLKQLIPFDQDRVAHMNLESVRKRIRPMLVNGLDVQEISTQLGSQAPTRTVFGDLYWISVVRWDGTRPATPIGPKAVASWNISADEISKIDLSNLAADPVEGSLEITSFGTLGRIGTFKP